MGNLQRVVRSFVVTGAMALAVFSIGISPAEAAGHDVNACGCYRDTSGGCFCGKKSKCDCPGDCEPKGCEEKRARDMEKEIQAETRRAQDAERKQQQESEARRKKEEQAAEDEPAAASGNSEVSETGAPPPEPPPAAEEGKIDASDKQPVRPGKGKLRSRPKNK